MSVPVSEGRSIQQFGQGKNINLVAVPERKTAAPSYTHDWDCLRNQIFVHGLGVVAGSRNHLQFWVLEDFSFVISDHDFLMVMIEDVSRVDRALYRRLRAHR